MRDHVLDEVLADEALALEPALHVAEAEQHGVDRAVGHGLAQLVDVHAPASSRSALSIASNSSSGADATRWWREYTKKYSAAAA